jgi:hypothetical protein
MFFQLNMCIGVWITGLIFHLLIGAPPIQPSVGNMPQLIPISFTNRIVCFAFSHPTTILVPISRSTTQLRALARMHANNLTHARPCPFTPSLYSLTPKRGQAMIGGALWATGNMLCPFIIDCIGIGVGLLIWGTANLCIGWLSAHFGILGEEKETVSNNGLNVTGFIIAVVVGATPTFPISCCR